MAATQIDNTTQETARKTLDMFRDNFTQDIATLEFKASMYLSGKHHAKVRQAIVYIITGELQPVSKCTLAMTAEYMKGQLMQTSLF